MVFRGILLSEGFSKQPAPVTLPELVDWLAAHRGLEDKHQNRTILDAWNRPIVLVARGGKLETIGSAGPNERWENGNGDDILVDIEKNRHYPDR